MSTKERTIVTHYFQRGKHVRTNKAVWFGSAYKNAVWYLYTHKYDADCAQVVNSVGELLCDVSYKRSSDRATIRLNYFFLDNPDADTKEESMIPHNVIALDTRRIM